MNSLTKARSLVVAALLVAAAGGRIFAMPPQYNEEVEFVKTAANRGNVEAQFLLGLRYSFGDGVREDPVAAERWWRVAAEQGFVPAMRELGEFYLLQGTDWSLAGSKWLTAAAGKGDEESRELLASLMAKGLLGRQFLSPEATVTESHPDGSPWAGSANDRPASVFPSETPAERAARNPPIIAGPKQDGTLQPGSPATARRPAEFPISGWFWAIGTMALAALASVWLGRRS